MDLYDFLWIRPDFVLRWLHRYIIHGLDTLKNYLQGCCIIVMWIFLHGGGGAL